MLVCGVEVEECKVYNCLQLLRDARREVRRIESGAAAVPFPKGTKL